jgi:hypothetical protein
VTVGNRESGRFAAWFILCPALLSTQLFPHQTGRQHAPFGLQLRLRVYAPEEIEAAGDQAGSSGLVARPGGHVERVGQ